MRTTSLPLAMFAMLLHGSLLSASTAALTESLAVAAMSATAKSISLSLDAIVVILVWNLGTAALIVAVGSWLGQQ